MDNIEEQIKKHNEIVKKFQLDLFNHFMEKGYEINLGLFSNSMVQYKHLQTNILDNLWVKLNNTNQSEFNYSNKSYYKNYTNTNNLKVSSINTEEKLLQCIENTIKENKILDLNNLDYIDKNFFLNYIKKNKDFANWLFEKNPISNKSNFYKIFNKQEYFYIESKLCVLIQESKEFFQLMHEIDENKFIEMIKDIARDSNDGKCTYFTSFPYVKNILNEENMKDFILDGILHKKTVAKNKNLKTTLFNYLEEIQDSNVFFNKLIKKFPYLKDIKENISPQDVLDNSFEKEENLQVINKKIDIKKMDEKIQVSNWNKYTYNVYINSIHEVLKENYNIINIIETNRISNTNNIKEIVIIHKDNEFNESKYIDIIKNSVNFLIENKRNENFIKNSREIVNLKEYAKKIVTKYIVEKELNNQNNQIVKKINKVKI